MSTHSYSRLWTHLIWETLDREPMLDKRAAAKASSFLTEYSLEKGIYMKINYFNADHTHALIDLPTRYSIEDVIKLFKGVHRIGLTTAESLKAGLPGVVATEPFPFHTLTLDVSRGTSPIKRNIIASGRIRKSTRCLLSGMAWNGGQRETIKMVAGCFRALDPNLKVGENERLANQPSEIVLFAGVCAKSCHT